MDREHPMRDEPVADLADEEGGDPVCWAHLVSWSAAPSPPRATAPAVGRQGTGAA